MAKNAIKTSVVVVPHQNILKYNFFTVRTLNHQSCKMFIIILFYSKNYIKKQHSICNMIDTSIITFFLFYCNSCLFGSYGFLLALTDPDILFSTKAKMCPTQGSKTSVVKTPPYVTVLQHKHKPQKQSCGKSCDFFCIILIMDLRYDNRILRCIRGSIKQTLISRPKPTRWQYQQIQLCLCKVRQLLSAL